MAWGLLLLAGIFEVIWAYSMKLSDGFSKLTPSIITLFFMLLSFGLLSIAMRTLSLGTAYTIWVGIGAIGAFLIGIFVLNEPMGVWRLFAAALIVIGVMLMKVSSPA